jgi:hypothetical protein
VVVQLSVGVLEPDMRAFFETQSGFARLETGHCESVMGTLASAEEKRSFVLLHRDVQLLRLPSHHHFLVGIHSNLRTSSSIFHHHKIMPVR